MPLEPRLLDKEILRKTRKKYERIVTRGQRLLGRGWKAVSILVSVLVSILVSILVSVLVSILVSNLSLS